MLRLFSTISNLLSLGCAVILILTTQAAELRKLDFYQGYAYNSDRRFSRNLDKISLYNSAAIEPGCKVRAEFGDIYYQENNQTSGYMTIIISSDESGFFGDFIKGLGIEPFYCASSYCREDGSPVEYNSHFLQGSTSHISLNTSFSIADGAWQLNTPALFFQEYPEFMQRINFNMGWIGLGTGSGASKNFKDENAIFSITFDYPSKSGSLIFGFDSKRADLSKTSPVLKTDASWQMQMVSISVGDALVYFNETEPLPVTFDLVAYDFILPGAIKDGILEQLKSLDCFGTYCVSESLADFPPIIFTFSDGAQLSFGPEIYLRQDRSNTGAVIYYTISFSAQRTPQKQKSQIILGSEILAHFYSVFQLLNGVNTITLYSLASNASIEQGFPPYQVPSAKSEVPVASDLILFRLIKFTMIGVCIVGLIIVSGWRLLKKWFGAGSAQTHQRVNMELSEQESENLTFNT